MNFLKYSILFGFLWINIQALAQDSNPYAFSSLKLGNLQSSQVANAQELHLYVGYRFGTSEDNTTTIDKNQNTNSHIQIVYGLADGLHIGLGWEDLRQTLSGNVKINLLTQSIGSAFDLTAYGNMNINTELSSERYPKMKTPDRFTYTSQLLLARRLGNYLSLELAPGFVRQNLVWEPFQAHNQAVLGIGAAIQLTKSLNIHLDYTSNLSRATESVYADPFTIGLDYTINNFVAELFLTNALSFNDPGFMTNAAASDIYIGLQVGYVFR